MAITFSIGRVSPLYKRRTDRYIGMHEVYYNQIKYLEFPETDRITPSVNDRSYIVRAGQEGRLDVIAKEVYGDPSRWQVIANANDIFNPFLEMYAGMPLRIPPLEEL